MNPATVTGARDSRVADCSLLDLTTRAHPDVAVVFGTNCPFAIRRVYYLFDVPAGAVRGGHAHRILHQLVIAACGRFDVTLDDGRDQRVLTLDASNRALHLVPGIWRELSNFSAGSICLVMASAPFEEADYLRQYEEFLAFKARPPRR